MVTAYQRLHRATAFIRSEVDWPLNRPDTAACSCCGRAWAEVEEPDRAIPFQYGNPYYYRNHTVKKQFAIEWQCTTCQTLRTGSLSALGVERHTPQATPVAQRLSMLAGGGAVVTADDTLHLAVKPGHWTKFEHGELAAKGRIHVCQPLTLLLRLRNASLLGPIEKGVVLIEDFGRQPEGLMSTLQLTTAWSEVWANSYHGPRMIELDRLDRLHGLLGAGGQIDAATRPAFWQPIADAASGRFDAEALATWTRRTQDSQDIVAQLPLNPHLRRRLHLELQALHAAQMAPAQEDR